MDYDSPDWDRTPTESIEVKDEAPHLTKAEAVEPSTNDTKLELTKKEEDSPQHTPMLCPPVSTVPGKTSTTSTSPPAKAPLFPTHLTGTCPHATRHRQTPNQHQHSLQPHFRIPRHHLHHHLPHPLPALRTLSSSPPMFPFYPKHVRGTHQSIPPGWAPQLYHAPHSATPTRIPLQVTIPRPHRNGQLLPFNFSTDIKHYLNPTAHSTRRPATSRPAPPTHFHPTTTTNTTTVFPPVPPIPDAPLTEQQAATLQQTILRIACQAAAAAAAELNSRRSSS